MSKYYIEKVFKYNFYFMRIAETNNTRKIGSYDIISTIHQVIHNTRIYLTQECKIIPNFRV